MKLKHAAIAASLAILLPASLQTAAHARHFRFSNRLHAAHHGHAPGGWPFFSGGIVAVPPYAPVNWANYAAPPSIIYVPVPPRALTCHRTRETVTVPVQAGGTRQITITRC
jgi:hypothetical protein